MKKTKAKRKTQLNSGALRSEYRFDYRKARTNRFVSSYKSGSRLILLDPDIAEVFTTPESVNAVLRALLDNMPRKGTR